MAFLISAFVQTILVFAVGYSIIYALRPLLRIGRRRNDMPPGPPTLPIIGNEHQIPRADGHFQLTKWAEKYGGIYALKRFANTTIVITDRQVAKKLLDKKSNIYSHRPNSLVAHLITKSDHLLVMHYGDAWRKIRKLVHQYFMESVCQNEHHHVQDAEAIQMVYDFLTEPEKHMLHPKRYSNSITNSLVFGIRTKTIHDDYMNRLFYLMDKWSQVMEVGSTPPVDSFLPLRLIPERLLGYWKQRALDVRSLMVSLYSDVLDQVRDRRKQGIQRDSFIDRVLDQQEKAQLTENQLLFLGGVLMEGGSDTSSSLILAIIQAMIRYPKVQERAHAEIDAVISNDRSPKWSDFHNLPYINMIIKESHRWRPVSPLGVSHALAEDDWIDGLYLPKGSTIVMNVWGMHHDPNIWTSPEHFEPERFASYPSLAPAYAASGEWDGRDHFGYGFGRRICPGIHLAERNLFIGVAKLLWAFEFTPEVGMEVDTSPETGMSQGFLHCVKNFGCRIEVRGEGRKATVCREMEQVREVFERFD